MLWKVFMSLNRGELFSGPFSQVLIVFSQLGWQIHPPFFVDHDGCQHNLLAMDSNTLMLLATDGWLQYVASQVTHRKTMTDLCGIDASLVHQASQKHNALEGALLSALQSGAFVGTAMHSKYDFTKQTNCGQCQEPDGPAHWLVCPRHHTARRHVDGWVDDHPHDTMALRQHLLPSRSTHWPRWKRALLEIADHTQDFWSQPCMGTNHLFTDGSATRTGTPYELAAWSVVNASTGQVVAAGPVPGLCQSNDRAELLAVLAAVRWQAHCHADVHLWIDAKYVASGVQFLLLHGVVADAWVHQDLWTALADELQCLQERQLVPHWIPSHLDEGALESPYEDWVRVHNDQADRQAGVANLNRPHALLSMQSEAIGHHRSTADRLRQLKFFISKFCHSR